jgi:hypothetical protein
VQLDTKGFFNKAKTTTMATHEEFIKATSECDKDNITEGQELKIKAILNSKFFKDENLKQENTLVVAIKDWA